MYRVRTIAVAAAFSLISTTSFADSGLKDTGGDYPNWSGIYGGIGGGIGVFKGDTTFNQDETHFDRLRCLEIDPDEGPNDFGGTCDATENSGADVFTDERLKSFNSKSSDSDIGLFGTGIIGFDRTLGSRLLIGGFIDIDFGKRSLEASAISETAGINPDLDGFTQTDSAISLKSEVEYDSSYTFGGRIGVLTSDRKSLFYLMGGYTIANADASLSLTLDEGTATKSSNVPDRFLDNSFDKKTVSFKSTEDIEGYTLGGGLESHIRGNWFFRVEGRYTHLNAVRVNYSDTTDDEDNVPLASFELDSDNCVGGPDGAAGTGDCILMHDKQISVDGTAEVDPHIWSVRAVLTYKFGRNRHTSMK